MNDALAITAASMLGSMERLDVISHNIANANTTGYKRNMLIGMSFEAQMRTSLAELELGRDSAMDAPFAGFRYAQDMNDGAMVYTGDALNVAIEGKGFFQILGGTELMYTRDGSFQRDASGRLVNARGLPVAGESGEIHLNEGDIFIDAQAQLWQDGRTVGRLRIADFADPAQLVKRGGGLYASNGTPALPISDEAIRVRQGYVETSNVAVMQEMVDLMSTLRHFEMSQHVVKGYDEMIGAAIESLGRF